MRITISELKSSISESLLDELTPWEMKNLTGGYTTRRERQKAEKSNINDLSELLKQIDDDIDKWKTSLGETANNLRKEFGF